VNLIFSVAEAPGGGAFLDMAFLLRKLGLKNITGIMMLPNVYYETPRDERSRSIFRERL